MPLYNALRNALWLGVFAGFATGSLFGVVFIVAFYPVIHYVDLIVFTAYSTALGTFLTATIVFALEYVAATRTGIQLLWGDHDSEEIINLRMSGTTNVGQ
jgi:hypothetical protein